MKTTIWFYCYEVGISINIIYNGIDFTFVY